MKLNTAFLGVIAAALTLPQIPAAHRFVHNNVIYPVQLEQYEKARAEYVEDVKTYCQENWNVWVSRNRQDRDRYRSSGERGRYLPVSYVKRSVQGCIRTFTEVSTAARKQAYSLHKQTPKFTATRPTQI